MGIFDFFSGGREQEEPAEPLKVDMHSHLLAGIDDGAQNLEESLQLVQEMIALGYKKLVLTPHIMGDFFRNTPEIIGQKLEELKAVLIKNQLHIELEAAAEYYLDEFFMKMLSDSAPMLSFGNRYLLFETSYINKPSYFQEALFQIKTLGYKPVLAHPERYTYLYSGFSNFEALYEQGVLFQINLNSFSGYYSKAAQKFAQQLAERNMIDFLGTDCHGIRHIDALKRTRTEKMYTRLLRNPKILNNSLLK